MLTLTERARQEIEKFADTAIDEIITAIRNNPTISGKPAHASGETERSLEREWIGDVMVISGAGHIFTLEFGRKPTLAGGTGSTGTLRERIREWIDVKGIAQALSDKAKNSMAWAISTNIHKRGTLLYQSIKNGGSPSGTLSAAVNDEKLAALGKELLNIFVLEFKSKLIK